MARKPYQSSLLPYGAEIIAWRRKRPPMPYSRIVELLGEKYQITVSREAVFYFIKRRVKKEYKPCKYDAWNIELPEEPKQPEAPSAQKATASKLSVQEKPKQKEKEKEKK